MLALFKRFVQFFKRNRARCVHVDQLGNKYYSKMVGAKEKRWVEYSGHPDPSTIPAECHVWLHYTSDVILPTKNYSKVHKPNLTGTEHAYHPHKPLVREKN